MSVYVGQCRQFHIPVVRCRKYGVSLFNRVAMSFNSKVMCTRLFGIRHLEIRMPFDMSRDQFYAPVGLF